MGPRAKGKGQGEVEWQGTLLRYLKKNRSDEMYTGIGKSNASKSTSDMDRQNAQLDIATKKADTA